MQNRDDLKTSITMYFRQIISLVELINETNNKEVSNIITIANLAELGLAEAEKLEESFQEKSIEITVN